MRPIQSITAPTRREQFTLRLMITFGLISMGFFLHSMFNVSLKGYFLLYWMLIATFIFTCLKTLHEWLHYLFITVPKTPATTKTYTVDIFTTFCAGEPYGMIEETLKAIQAITYPHQTYLCDEANDPYLKQLCQELGVHHVTRTLKINAKAGNINNALKQSSGELCVILDPDHVPFPNFLDPIVSHFNHPEVGFVQIVQAYKNNYENLIAKGAAQQTYQFYGPMMMTMNKYGTVLAIGANCTFRRTALESIGGHAAGLAEDMHTAMQLHSKGWKSVYIPRVLARGLVPSTLSAYYKQQLKWSRGVFDLLVNTYPKLFKGFTWKQKIHYAIIPMHYLSGVIYLINFLIPIISLFFDVSPIRMNITDFGLAIFPFIAATLMIRHFVQWWVMEDDERGFHVVGGLLTIGTWWIFILGLVYTIIGKKVPYVPTPKDGNEANNWPLNIPNITVLLLSLAAIIYGLNFDWNPYNLIMAGFAGINSLILLFNIVASRQQQLAELKARHPFAHNFIAWIQRVKINFWLIRRRMYTGIRSAALIITIVISCAVLYFAKVAKAETVHIRALDHQSNLFLTGIFAPQGFDGITSLKRVEKEQQTYHTHYDMVSIYIPWGDKVQCYIPQKTVDSIYHNGSIPMITWEPWQNLFQQHEFKKDEKVFNHIVNGQYDEYLQKFSDQIKALNKPVYVRFAHEMDNPFYPWSKTGNNTPKEFKTAWKYLHHFFLERGNYNIMWVWNPWKAETVQDYFPGKQFVDWIGVTNLNYGHLNSNQQWTAMEDLYSPFHQSPVFRSGLPVMLAEMGSISSAGRQAEWFESAFKAKKKFKEIKAFIFFNSAYDKNVPDHGAEALLNWTIQNPDSLRNTLQEFSKDAKKPATIPQTAAFLTTYAKQNKPITAISNEDKFFAGTRGINYNTAQDWKKNYQTVTMNQIISDFNEMKKIGINTIKRYGPDIYDRNILKCAKMTGTRIHYAYWISDDISFVNNQKELEKLRKKILTSVNSLKNNENIVSWNIGNAVLQKLELYYYKPELLYQQDAYLSWLKKLITSIKKIDSKRYVTVDVEVSENMIPTIERMKRAIPEIDSYGLSLNQKSTGLNLIDQLEVPYFYTDIKVSAYLQLLEQHKAGIFISNWQDQKKIDQVVVNGIKDDKGREKLSYSQLLHTWNNGPAPVQPPMIKILKPALGTFAGTGLKYNVLIKKNNNWIIPLNEVNDLKFEWNLVKVDRFRNPISMEHVGEGTSLWLRIPENSSLHRLYLSVIKGDQVLETITSELNTPL